jgi:hypothetical protein
LAVDESELTLAQELDSARERHFRGVRGAREHRLADEHAAAGDAIQAADECAVSPSFERVRPAELMQATVGAGDVRRNPRAAAVMAWLCACGHHVIECGVNAKFEAAGVERAAQAARNLESVRPKHGPRVGAPPQDRLTFLIPGKDAARVGGKQSGRLQVAACGQQAVRLGKRFACRRERFGASGWREPT